MRHMVWWALNGFGRQASRPHGRAAALRAAALAATAIITATGTAAAAATRIEGQVQAGGSAVGGASVTLWAADAQAPTRLAEVRSGADGRFAVSVEHVPSRSSLYLVAEGGEATANRNGTPNPGIGLIAVLGATPPVRVVVNEMTTIASVWTHAQFLRDGAIRGHALGLRIAAGNVPNFVDLETGGWGATIQDPLNSSQTPTMANFATLADLLAGCTTRTRPDACGLLFAAATPPTGGTPANTLAAAEAIARNSWHQPERLFALLDQFYPMPQGRNQRAVPYMPYLRFAPSAWVLPLKFDGGGYRAGGKAMFDAEGNLWVGNNFTVGWQGQDSLWQGSASRFAPNGRPLSPITTGYTGGGMEGGTFGAAVDGHGNAWFSTYGSRAIAVFDRDGRPVSPPEGITFNGRLGLMQGIIATPAGDIWALGIEKRQLVHFPGGDIARGRIVCEGDSAEPCRSFRAPFHLGIDQQDRIWVSDSGHPYVIRFPAAEPTRVVTFDVGYNSSGLGIDSRGNVWLTDRFGAGLLGMYHLVDMGIRLRLGGVDAASDYLTRTMSRQQGGRFGGSVALLRPDGTPYPGSPFTGGGLPGPWAVAVDGNDNIWISNFAAPNSPIVQLCGVRTETCPPGVTTGGQISPPSGYVGGGLQMLTDIAVDPAGNVWAMNNWQDIDACLATTPNEAISTRCGGQGVVIFYGMAAPVSAPQIGPARAP